MAAVLNESERSDIQGNILRAYGFRYARYSILRVDNPAGARLLLTNLLAQNYILSAALWDLQKDAKPTSAINVSFTYSGLAAMGVSSEKLATFPREFAEGMAARASDLGDKGPDAPDKWTFGRDPAQTHVFVTVCGVTPEAKEEMVAKLYAELAKVGAAVAVTHRLDVAAFNNHREHFGYADGIGQPSIEGSGERALPGAGTLTKEGWVPIKAGEFVLGYEGETGTWPVPGGSFGRNGSFMVYRQLAQDVPAFREFLRAQAARVYQSDEPSFVEKLAAKFVGRWRSGCPLALSPDKDNPEQVKNWETNNHFSYADDPQGAKCPIGSHIRRMNPRDAIENVPARTHRIVRRGLPYGSQLPEGAPDDGAERGIAFMAINASIEHQFEVLQKDWANRGDFAGLDADDVDPIIGERKKDARFRLLDAQGKPKRMTLQRFVTLRGGGYFFIPSLSALRTLAAGTA